jgi:hypothetical protein
MTEEFEQRLKVELARSRENYEDQIESLQRERDTAHAQFDALKLAVYHPKQAAPKREDDGIPRLPERDEASGDEDRSALEQRLIAEQAQLHAQLRKNRQLLDDQRQQFEEEKQALIAEANRLRRRDGRQISDTNAVEPSGRSRAFKTWLYLALFVLAAGSVVAIKFAIDWARRSQ